MKYKRNIDINTSANKSRINTEKITSTHIFKLLKTEDEEKTSKAAKIIQHMGEQCFR